MASDGQANPNLAIFNLIKSCYFDLGLNTVEQGGQLIKELASYLCLSKSNHKILEASLLKAIAEDDRREIEFFLNLLLKVNKAASVQSVMNSLRGIKETDGGVPAQSLKLLFGVKEHWLKSGATLADIL